MILLKSPTDSLFDSNAEVLVNPVNCMGVGGKGLALEFKRLFPYEQAHYERYCSLRTHTGERWFRPGKIAYWGRPDDRGEVYTKPLIVFASTKDRWRDPSKLEWIQPILTDLKEMCGTFTIALPALGCGLGGLKWEMVRPLIEGAFSDYTGTAYVYPPQ